MNEFKMDLTTEGAYQFEEVTLQGLRELVEEGTHELGVFPSAFDRFITNLVVDEKMFYVRSSLDLARFTVGQITREEFDYILENQTSLF